MTERACCRCGREITACNGFVKAGDCLDKDGNFILYYKDPPYPRELCGRCVLRWRWNEAGELEEWDELLELSRELRE